MSQLKKGAILSYINIALNIIIGLLLTPFIIRTLGDSEYGLYTLMGSFVAYLSLMDLGLNNTIVRFVAKYRAEKDKEGERIFLGSTMLLYVLISLLVVILGIFLFFRIDEIFKDSLTKSQIEDAKIIFLILVLNISITLPGNSFTAICNAYENFVYPRVLNIVRYILRALTVIAVLNFSKNAISLVIIDTFYNLIIIILTSIYVKYELGLKIHFKNFNLKIIKSIFSYSIWIFLFAIIQNFQWHTGQVILGINLNTNMVAIYGIGIMLGTSYGAFAGAINSVLLPRATQMIMNNSNGSALTSMMIKFARLSNYINFLIMGGFFLFGKDFIKLWVGEGYFDSWMIAIFIMIAITVPLSQSFGNSILEAHNKIAFRAITGLITVTLGAIFGYLLSKSFGINGMIIPIVSSIVINTVITNFYFRSIFQFEVYRFFKNSYCKQIIVTVVLSLIFFFLKGFYELDTFFKLISGMIIYSFLYLATIIMFVLNEEERLKLYIGYERKNS